MSCFSDSNCSTNRIGYFAEQRYDCALDRSYAIRMQNRPYVFDPLRTQFWHPGSEGLERIVNVHYVLGAVATIPPSMNQNLLRNETDRICNRHLGFMG